jgi:hypothetical protein
MLLQVGDRRDRCREGLRRGPRPPLVRRADQEVAGSHEHISIGRDAPARHVLAVQADGEVMRGDLLLGVPRRRSGRDPADADVPEGIPAISGKPHAAALIGLIGDAQRPAAVHPDTDPRPLRLDAHRVPAVGLAGHARHPGSPDVAQVAVSVHLSDGGPEVLGPKLLATPGEVHEVEVVDVRRPQDQARAAGSELAVVGVELEVGDEITEGAVGTEGPAVEIALVGRADDLVRVLGPRPTQKAPSSAVADGQRQRLHRGFPRYNAAE